MKTWETLRVRRSSTRLIVMAVIGITAALVTSIWGDWVLTPIVGWAAACVTFIGWVWLVIAPMDAATTASHATREDPSRGVSDLLVLLISLASLGALGLLLIETHSTTGAAQVVLALVSVLSVVLSWTLLHTLFTLRYARLYYEGADGGIEFNQNEPPSYGDFAYLAFTLGMTFQVSDTNLQTHAIRMTALRHGLLSYLFGSVILATMINLVAGLLH
ncbi:DUF1345 domain-containing protein [Cryobacterium algoricola]|uniref:DUF1345 domain-containing protein n=2 Tax=Cryobacterium TaxID=69578 RepID=A0AA41UF32_9MICO|nr:MULTISPECIES: DUF1345 domain-containing protein [Cryobacterium]MCI4657682.1 DUF1345 domain-containing protein [Cryobacterium zhongshanensis]TFB90270.1 DUF1345 domain-containing protein [Cryobacterium algoricola]